MISAVESPLEYDIVRTAFRAKNVQLVETDLGLPATLSVVPETTRYSRQPSIDRLTHKDENLLNGSAFDCRSTSN